MNHHLKQLYEKAGSFFDEVQRRHGGDMQCKAGCSRCCYVDLSVFEVEAASILEWFSSLPSEQQAALKAKWKEPVPRALSFHDVETSACVFLKDDRCTIYEARPLICRTQGLPLKFRLDFDEAIDACPLNFKEAELELTDCLDLDKVNSVLSQIEWEHSKGEAPRVKLTDLLKKMD